MEIVKLKKPVTFEGAEYKELKMDFDSLTGRDMLAAEKEARAMGDRSPIAEFSKLYLASVAARAAKVPIELILDLPAVEFTAITVNVQTFFVPAG